ncbi:hypothetical protein GCM10010440_09110 [Kitasatospora cinereorecta]
MVGLWTVIGIGYAVRCGVLGRRADRAWEPEWEQIEPLWFGRSSRGPEPGDR